VLLSQDRIGLVTTSGAMIKGPDGQLTPRVRRNVEDLAKRFSTMEIQVVPRDSWRRLWLWLLPCYEVLSRGVVFHMKHSGGKWFCVRKYWAGGEG